MFNSFAEKSFCDIFLENVVCENESYPTSAPHLIIESKVWECIEIIWLVCLSVHTVSISPA